MKVVNVMKPMIGITALVDEKMDSYWMLPAYMDMVKYAGGIPVMLSVFDDLKIIEELVGRLDGFIIAGGQDINPFIYNENIDEKCGELCSKRDSVEVPLLLEIIKAKKPLLGICRGFQLMNSLLGGSLYQDINSMIETNVNHRQDKPYDRPNHSVNVAGVLKDIVGTDKIMVNSCHHQAVKDVSKYVDVVAVSEDGIVEGISIKDYFFGLGVQWHPEMLNKKDEASVKIFKAFINSCKK